jgi:hypothetical protein
MQKKKKKKNPNNQKKKKNLKEIFLLGPHPIKLRGSVFAYDYIKTNYIYII